MNCRFKDAVIIYNGRDYKHIESDEGYPVMGSGGSFAFASDYLYDGEVILLGRKGTIDRPLYYVGKFWSVDTMYYAAPKKGFCGKFLYYCSLNFPFLKYSTATALPSMTKSVLECFPIPKLNIAEQEAIAAYLDRECAKIDRRVALLGRKADAYRRLRRALINQTVTRGLNPDAPMKPSGNDWIGDISAHWGFERIGKYFHSNTLYNKNFEYTRAFKFFMGTIIPKEEDRDAEEYRDVYEKYTIVEQNDIMINGLNLNYDLKSVRVAIVPYKGIITSAYVVLRPFDGVNAKFFNYLFKALDYRKFFHGMGKGVRITLSFNELRSFEIPIPPQQEQKEIVAYLDERCGKIDAIIAKIEAQMERLRTLRRSLINEVVTGRRAIN